MTSVLDVHCENSRIRERRRGEGKTMIQLALLFVCLFVWGIFVLLWFYLFLFLYFCCCFLREEEKKHKVGVVGR